LLSKHGAAARGACIVRVVTQTAIVVETTVLQVFKFVSGANISRVLEIPDAAAVPHPEVNGPALDGLVIAVGSEKAEQTIVSEFVKMEHFQTLLNLVDYGHLLGQLLSGSTVGAVESHVQPRNPVIKFNA
jgi:hypothetical protein